MDTGRQDSRPAVAVVTGKSRSVGADIAMRLVTDSSVAKETLWRFLSYRGTGMRAIGTAGETEHRDGRAVELMQHGESPTAKPHPGPQPRLTDEQIRELEGLLLRGAKAPVQETWHCMGRISAISDVTISPVLRRSDLVLRLLPNDAHAHGQENFARVGPTHRGRCDRRAHSREGFGL